MIANNMELARENMVKQQLRTWEVLDAKVLKTVTEIPRQDFVPDDYREMAFADIEISIGQGQKMMAPVLEARMLQALDIQPDDVILEIGTGSGFATACMATLGAQVISVDVHSEFTEQAKTRLEKQEIGNVKLVSGNGLTETFEGGPFDAIAVTGSVRKIPEKLKRQLTMGGRMFIVAGEAPAMEAYLVTRVGDYQWREESLFETDLGPLENPEAVAPFVF